MPRLSQEMITIIGVGIALAALILTTTSGLRGEIQAVRVEAHADREAMRAEAHADREAMRAEARASREAMRAEAHADREAIRAQARADREAFEQRVTRLDAKFEQHIIRLTEQQGALSGLVEGLRHRQLSATGSDDPSG